MEVYKFGGASVKDADAVRNVAAILKSEVKEPTCVVVSAMGKTTNALEAVLDAFYHGKENRDELLKGVLATHLQILAGLFSSPAHPVYGKLKALFLRLANELGRIQSMPYDKAYDQVVSFGERFSTCIISEYLAEAGIGNVELDASRIVLTDGHFREGKVLWEPTTQRIKEAVEAVWAQGLGIVLTQGFIACDEAGDTVTLGREGSDYSAAIFAYCLDAAKMTIWKDVPGVLNADPKYFSNTKKLDYVSYYDATELAYFGASIIHPKTIKPLQNKKIPLHVRSFMDVSPQTLLSIYPKDFSFVDETNLSEIFHCFVKNGIKVNLMQNSALSFSVCIDQNRGNLEAVLDELASRYDCRYNQGLELLTIRHYTQDVIDQIAGGKKVMLEQRTRHTVQMVLGGA